MILAFGEPGWTLRSCGVDRDWSFNSSLRVVTVEAFQSQDESVRTPAIIEIFPANRSFEPGVRSRWWTDRAPGVSRKEGRVDCPYTVGEFN